MNAGLLSPSRQATAGARTGAIVAIAGVVYFTLIIVALHFLRPDLNPVSQPTSEYAVGPYGILMTSAFFTMSIASLALIFGLSRGIAPSAQSRIGLGLVGIWGIGVLVAMLFPIDPEGAPQTFAGTIHRINGPIVFLCVTIGVLLLSWHFQREASWQPVRRTAQILSLLMLTAFIGTFLSVVTHSEYAGLFQRIDLAALGTWMVLTASRLYAVTGQD